MDEFVSTKAALSELMSMPIPIFISILALGVATNTVGFDFLPCPKGLVSTVFDYETLPAKYNAQSTSR